MSNRLQTILNATAGFVLNKYANTRDVVSLKWLPIVERQQYALAVLTFQSLHSNSCPSNLTVKLKPDRHSLRKNAQYNSQILSTNNKTNKYKYDTTRIFNDLPKKLRDCNELAIFKRLSRDYYLDKAIARSLENS